MSSIDDRNITGKTSPPPANQQKSIGNVSNTTGSIGGKEQEPIGIPDGENLLEVSTEMELLKEVEEAGVENISGTIELPPDVKKLGVTTGAQSLPKAQTSTLPQVSLPIPDEEVVKGEHAGVTEAIRWLVTWCFRKLNKAGIQLKSSGGKVVRVEK